jgi:hypothetical protein
VSLVWSAMAILVAVLVDAAPIRWTAVGIAIALPVMTLVLRWFATRAPDRYAKAVATAWGVPDHDGEPE